MISRNTRTVHWHFIAFLARNSLKNILNAIILTCGMIFLLLFVMLPFSPILSYTVMVNSKLKLSKKLLAYASWQMITVINLLFLSVCISFLFYFQILFLLKVMLN